MWLDHSRRPNTLNLEPGTLNGPGGPERLEPLGRTELFLGSFCKEIIKRAENEASNRAG
jgi:hypothetical protein